MGLKSDVIGCVETGKDFLEYLQMVFPFLNEDFDKIKGFKNLSDLKNPSNYEHFKHRDRWLKLIENLNRVEGFLLACEARKEEIEALPD